MSVSDGDSLNLNDLYRKQRDWSERSLFLLRELLPLMAPVGKFDGWTPEQRLTIGALLAASARSSESVLLLCAYGQLWDAEVVLRSVFEGSLKFVYILQNAEEFERRYGQYSDDLFQIAQLKDHQKADELLNAVPDLSAKQWRGVRERLLSDSEQADLKSRYGRSVRRALETQWGFTGVMTTLARSSDALFAGFAALAYGYSLASHIQHADYLGVSIALERDFRSAERRDTLHLAHLARLISDVFACLHIRLSIGYRFISKDPSPIIVAWKQVETLTASFGTPLDDWMDVEYGKSSEAQVDD